MNKKSALREILQPAVLVGALGYFVDIYDLTLFGIVRVDSLKALGLTGDAILNQGFWLLNTQMVGMLVGGLAFGILGDRKGRLSVLFGSILLYSLANLLNGAVQSLPQYYALRFLAGVGLAGEIGGSITLVSEVLSRENRAYGTMIVATVGVTGAVVGNLIAKTMDWRMAYYVGGAMGLALLVLRVSVAESGMFKAMPAPSGNFSRGNFLALFTDRRRFSTYARCILIGIPTWFVVGVLAMASPELAAAMGIQGKVTPGDSVALVYVGLTVGDLTSGLLSQWLRSRKRVVLAFLLVTLAGMVAYFSLWGASSTAFYAVITLLGFGIGYWVLFITIAAEQFGTNLRSTVATTVPNFVRASMNLITLAFQGLVLAFGHKIFAAALVGAVCLAIALWALSGLEETHGKDLDYYEPI